MRGEIALDRVELREEVVDGRCLGCRVGPDGDLGRLPETVGGQVDRQAVDDVGQPAVVIARQRQAVDGERGRRGRLEDVGEGAAGA